MWSRVEVISYEPQVLAVLGVLLVWFGFVLIFPVFPSCPHYSVSAIMSQQRPHAALKAAVY